MDPKKVKPAKFYEHTVIYDKNGFSIAYGYWEEEGDYRLAMRWNGEGDSIGYPSQGGNPLWFQLPSEEIWTAEILKALKNIESFKETTEGLQTKLKNGQV